MSDMHPSSSASTASEQGMLPEIMYSLASLANLTAFYESGCNLSAKNSAQELRRHIVTHLRRVVCAQGACLLLYQPAPPCFLQVASQGDIPAEPLAAALAELPISQFMRGGPGEMLTRLPFDDRYALLVTLSLNAGPLGIVALALSNAQPLGDERQLLLAEMGRVAAHLLHDHEYHQRLRLESAEAERKRIACDLHDGLAQQLTHVSHKLAYIQRLLEKQQPELLLPQVRRVQEIVQESLRGLRYSIDALLPDHENDRTFSEKMYALLREYRKNHTRIELRCKMTGVDERFRVPETLEKSLLGFVQEALTNVWKHSHATQARLHLRLFPGRLLLEVSDNGIGFRPEWALRSPTTRELAEDEPHFGLRLMRERIQALGGCWELRSSPGQGTSVRAQIPLPASPPHH